jgi:hypothetical protein
MASVSGPKDLSSLISARLRNILALRLLSAGDNLCRERSATISKP